MEPMYSVLQQLQRQMGDERRKWEYWGMRTGGGENWRQEKGAEVNWGNKGEEVYI